MNKDDLLFCKKIQCLFTLYCLSRGGKISNNTISCLRMFYLCLFEDIKKGELKNEKNIEN